jgi:hypothetical protein
VGEPALSLLFSPGNLRQNCTQFFSKKNILSQRLANFMKFHHTPTKSFARFRQLPIVKSGFSARFSAVLRVFQYLATINAKSLFG